VPICTELMTPAGPVDNFMVTASGMPVLVECKLWRNPQARREVVGQVLDYAKELSRWRSADIEREARKRGVPSLLDRVRAVHPGVDEAMFHDSLTRNLGRGRCLLLIVGDGIREGVEAIFEHLRDQSMLHFSLGLVELPVYALPDGGRLVVPRIVARTAVEVRRVVELPQGMVVAGDDEDEQPTGMNIGRSAAGIARLQFWTAYLAALKLDDAEQPLPEAAGTGWLRFFLPVGDKSCWIVAFREVASQSVGLYLVGTGRGIGERVVGELHSRMGEIGPMLGGTAGLSKGGDGHTYLRESAYFEGLDTPEVRAQAAVWLAERTNQWINVLRPLARSIAADIAERDQ
jgi:hypothetical protein